MSAFPVAAAGSLLGVKLTKGFPVGKVNFIDLYPLTFREFLDAYLLDFAKHAPKDQLMKIMTVWKLVPSQLAKENKKFIFSVISQSARGREYEVAIQWLIDVGLVIRANHIVAPRLPLSAYANRKAFKVLLLDVGLLGAMTDLSYSTILNENRLFTEFKGALTENHVAQALHYSATDELYYWSSEGKAEVEFLVPYQDNVYPLEVKSGGSRKKKSLLVYGDKYLSDSIKAEKAVLSRTSPMNFASEGIIANYPLYAIHLFPNLLLSCE